MRSVETWHFRWPWVTSEGHFGTPITSCALLTHDVIAIAKFLILFKTVWHVSWNISFISFCESMILNDFFVCICIHTVYNADSCKHKSHIWSVSYELTLLPHMKWNTTDMTVRWRLTVLGCGRCIGCVCPIIESRKCHWMLYLAGCRPAFRYLWRLAVNGG